MKAAVPTLVAIYLECPECDESISNPENGAFLFSSLDFPQENTIKCDNCGAVLKLPKIVFGQRVTNSKK